MVVENAMIKNHIWLQLLWFGSGMGKMGEKRRRAVHKNDKIMIHSLIQPAVLLSVFLRIFFSF